MCGLDSLSVATLGDKLFAPHNFVLILSYLTQRTPQVYIFHFSQNRKQKYCLSPMEVKAEETEFIFYSYERTNDFKTFLVAEKNENLEGRYF